MSAKQNRLEESIANPHRILGIYVTFRCPLECGHCGVDSHPRRQERIDPVMALEQIEKAARGGSVHTLHLNGGEPFLERQLLRDISHKARDLGLNLAITTSAHWATSPERARKVLDDLPILTQLMISTDRYHLPYVELDRVALAAEAAVERDVVTQVAICTKTGKEDEFVERVRAALGLELLKQVELIIFPLDPVGRAQAIPEAHWREVVEELPAGRCYQLNRPVLLHDGSVSACCNTGVTHRDGADNPLKLGNCYQHGIDELLSGVGDDYYIQAIRAGGPKFLAELAIEQGVTLSTRRFRQDDICQLCEVLLRDPAAQAVLKGALENPEVQKKVAVLRAAALGETEMLNKFLPQPASATRQEVMERSTL